jgi:3-hydroxybutyryl-CoA dehydrogenase
VTIDVLGVAGAGVMGSGVAQSAAQAGLEVILVDVDPEALDRSRLRIKHGLRLARMLNDGGGPPVAETLARVTFTTELAELGRAGFIIENIRERIADKEALFRQLDELCPAEVCFATNTSAIPVARLAAATRRAPRVLGIHFMNPVPQKPVVELIRGPETCAASLAVARALLARMGKEAVEVGDGPGFVGNRVLMLAVNEAVALVAEGVAPAGHIDLIFTRCLGHKMGPLATADLIGLDIVRDTLDVLAELAGARYAPHPHLVAMVGRGLLGQKTGEGFFPYPTP